MIRLVNLPKILDDRGNLSIIEEGSNIPFKIERAYWIYDVPGGEFRGSHAYKQTEELIIALSGSFDIIVHDGRIEKKFSMNRSYYGLYIPKYIWRTLENFSTNALALIVASTQYCENDYVRDFDEFLTFIK